MIFGGWKNPVFFRMVILLAGLLFLPWKGFGEDLGLSPLHWGVSLEDLNRLYQEQVNPLGELKPDLQRFEIDLQIQPRRSVKIPKGDLVALVETPKDAGPSSQGRLFGYLWEGKFFGKVYLFKDHSPLTPPEAAQRLKTLYPEGRLFRKFTGTTMSNHFEWNSERLRIFMNDQGVFYYDPPVLKRVLRETEKESQDRLKREGERRFLEHGKGPL
jgi:hypothetical protein